MIGATDQFLYSLRLFCTRRLRADRLFNTLEAWSVRSNTLYFHVPDLFKIFFFFLIYGLVIMVVVMTCCECMLYAIVRE